MSNKYSYRATETNIISIKDKNNDYLNYKDCLQNWENVAITIKHFAEVILNNRTKEIINNLYDENGKRKTGSAGGIGRTIKADSRQIGTLENSNAREFTNFTDLKVYSRVDDHIRSVVGACARGTDTRNKTYQSIINNKLFNGDRTFVSAGWSRTVRPSPSKPGKVLDFAIMSNLYCKVNTVNNDTIVYDVVCGDQWVKMEVFIPKHLRDAEKILQPKLVWDKNNNMTIILTGCYTFSKYKLSDRYIIGIDVGITHYVTYIVYDTIENRIVEQGTLSNYLSQELYTSIKKTRNQIANCWVKIQELNSPDNYNFYGVLPSKYVNKINELYVDIENQRSALSRKRKRMALESALEIRDISVKYGNAIVFRENLSWVGNTMVNGRWNCGELFHKIEEVLEKVGGITIWVNPSYTSQTCHKCGNIHKKTRVEGDQQFHINTDRSVHCDNCGYHGDRDVNASVNIALRGYYSKHFTTLINKYKVYDVQPDVPVYNRGSTPVWVRDKNKNKNKNKNADRTKSVPTFKKKCQEGKRLKVVSPVRIPLKYRSLNKKEVCVNNFRKACPSFFNGLWGSLLFCNSDGLLALSRVVIMGSVRRVLNT